MKEQHEIVPVEPEMFVQLLVAIADAGYFRCVINPLEGLYGKGNCPLTSLFCVCHQNEPPKVKEFKQLDLLHGVRGQLSLIILLKKCPNMCPPYRLHQQSACRGL